jgi:glycosyltransferase involved in cell wall biosynthesis
MATYNGEKYIKQQIDSILNQIDSNDELIISDDGSTDNTLKIIRSYDDNRIVLIHHKQNLKIKKNRYSNIKLATNNFENALRFVRGDYVFLSDQDDVWLKNRKDECLKYLKNYDIVLCNYNIINDNEKIICEKFLNKSPISKYIIFNILNMHFIGCCIAFNRKILNYILPFPASLFVHDIWIGSIGSKLGEFCFIDKILHSYRRHESNISYIKNSKNSIIFKIYYRVVLYVQILNRIHLIKQKILVGNKSIITPLMKFRDREKR